MSPLDGSLQLLKPSRLATLRPQQKGPYLLDALRQTSSNPAALKPDDPFISHLDQALFVKDQGHYLLTGDYAILLAQSRSPFWAMHVLVPRTDIEGVKCPTSSRTIVRAAIQLLASLWKSKRDSERSAVLALLASIAPADLLDKEELDRAARGLFDVVFVKQSVEARRQLVRLIGHAPTRVRTQPALVHMVEYVLNRYLKEVEPAGRVHFGCLADLLCAASSPFVKHFLQNASAQVALALTELNYAAWSALAKHHPIVLADFVLQEWQPRRTTEQRAFQGEDFDDIVREVIIPRLLRSRTPYTGDEEMRHSGAYFFRHFLASIVPSQKALAALGQEELEIALAQVDLSNESSVLNTHRHPVTTVEALQQPQFLISVSGIISTPRQVKLVCEEIISFAFSAGLHGVGKHRRRADRGPTLLNLRKNLVAQTIAVMQAIIGEREEWKIERNNCPNFVKLLKHVVRAESDGESVATSQALIRLLKRATNETCLTSGTKTLLQAILPCVPVAKRWALTVQLVSPSGQSRPMINPTINELEEGAGVKHALSIVPLLLQHRATGRALLGQSRAQRGVGRALDGGGSQHGGSKLPTVLHFIRSALPASGIIQTADATEGWIYPLHTGEMTPAMLRSGTALEHLLEAHWAAQDLKALHRRQPDASDDHEEEARIIAPTLEHIDFYQKASRRSKVAEVRGQNHRVCIALAALLEHDATLTKTWTAFLQGSARDYLARQEVFSNLYSPSLDNWLSGRMAFVPSHAKRALPDVQSAARTGNAVVFALIKNLPLRSVQPDWSPNEAQYAASVVQNLAEERLRLVRDIARISDVEAISGLRSDLLDPIGPMFVEIERLSLVHNISGGTTSYMSNSSWGTHSLHLNRRGVVRDVPYDIASLVGSVLDTWGLQVEAARAGRTNSPDWLKTHLGALQGLPFHHVSISVNKIPKRVPVSRGEYVDMIDVAPEFARRIKAAVLDSDVYVDTHRVASKEQFRCRVEQFWVACDQYIVWSRHDDARLAKLDHIWTQARPIGSEASLRVLNLLTRSGAMYKYVRLFARCARNNTRLLDSLMGSDGVHSDVVLPFEAMSKWNKNIASSPPDAVSSRSISESYFLANEKASRCLQRFSMQMVSNRVASRDNLLGLLRAGWLMHRHAFTKQDIDAVTAAVTMAPTDAAPILLFDSASLNLLAEIDAARNDRPELREEANSSLHAWSSVLKEGIRQRLVSSLELNASIKAAMEAAQNLRAAHPISPAQAAEGHPTADMQLFSRLVVPLATILKHSDMPILIKAVSEFILAHVELSAFQRQLPLSSGMLLTIPNALASHTLVKLSDHLLGLVEEQKARSASSSPNEDRAPLIKVTTVKGLLEMVARVRSTGLLGAQEYVDLLLRINRLYQQADVTLMSLVMLQNLAGEGAPEPVWTAIRAMAGSQTDREALRFTDTQKSEEARVNLAQRIQSALFQVDAVPSLRSESLRRNPQVAKRYLDILQMVLADGIKRSTRDLTSFVEANGVVIDRDLQNAINLIAGPLPFVVQVLRWVECSVMIQRENGTSDSSNSLLAFVIDACTREHKFASIDKVVAALDALSPAWREYPDAPHELKSTNSSRMSVSIRCSAESTRTDLISTFANIALKVGKEPNAEEAVDALRASIELVIDRLLLDDVPEARCNDIIGTVLDKRQAYAEITHVIGVLQRREGQYGPEVGRAAAFLLHIRPLLVSVRDKLQSVVDGGEVRATDALLRSQWALLPWVLVVSKTADGLGTLSKAIVGFVDKVQAMTGDAAWLLWSRMEKSLTVSNLVAPDSVPTLGSAILDATGENRDDASPQHRQRRYLIHFLVRSWLKFYPGQPQSKVRDETIRLVERGRADCDRAIMLMWSMSAVEHW